MNRRAFSVGRMPGFAFIAMLTFVFLYVPILTLIVYSFNEAPSMATWQGFSLRWYEAALSNRTVQDVSIRSLIIAVSAASAASIVSTMAALATTRSRNFPGQTMIYALINQPLMVPENRHRRFRC